MEVGSKIKENLMKSGVKWRLGVNQREFDEVGRKMEVGNKIKENLMKSGVKWRSGVKLKKI